MKIDIFFFYFGIVIAFFYVFKFELIDCLILNCIRKCFVCIYIYQKKKYTGTYYMGSLMWKNIME